MALVDDSGDMSDAGATPAVRRLTGPAIADPARSPTAAEGRAALVGKRRGMNAGLAPIPRVALTRAEAAAALGMSLDSFERYVQPELCLVRRGSMRLVPVAELRRWVADVAEHTL